MTAVRGRIVKLWLKVQEPRFLSVCYCGAYLMMAIAGTAVFLDPPRTMENGLGTALVYVWAGLLIFGGVLGSLTTLPGIWWLERPATIACMFAIAIYGAAILGLPLTQPSARIVSVCFIAFALLTFAVRLVKIKHFAYDPEK
ncbi:hypothetical protein [Arthrobacter sp. MA-N2]|uniref:hypothetical protein n=1 Tax=Arthrobacter sp. MA-N2 TaxID=1101188 RepID=UPI0012DC12AC|nr:hypothetical protein [Arthrobacter sp. MA-N2]